LAEQSGLLRGDILVSLDSIVLDTPSQLQALLMQISGPTQLQVSRSGHTFDVTLTPMRGKIGAYIAPNITLQRYQYNFPQSVTHGMVEVYHQIGFSFRTFGAIIKTSFSNTATREQKQEATAGIG